MYVFGFIASELLSWVTVFTPPLYNAHPWGGCGHPHRPPTFHTDTDILERHAVIRIAVYHDAVKGLTSAAR